MKLTVNTLRLQQGLQAALSPDAKHIDVPFNRPCFAGNEQSYIAQAVFNGHLSGDGPFTKKCQQTLQEILGIQKALLTTSCTHALEMAAFLLNISPGDEVIVPSYTFVSTINAFVIRGAKPIFIDIRPDTLNLDESQLEALITEKTKAVVAVHYAGVGCDMDIIQSICERYGIPIIEDNAHGFLGKYKNQYLGTFGAMSTLSFHETKNVQCGEGGALLINDARHIERAEIIREKGTNRSRYFRGQIDKYTWVDLGSSYLPSELSAAFLYAQLEKHQEIQASRAKIWHAYEERLRRWAVERAITLPSIPEHCQHPYHMFYLLMPSLEKRQALITYLQSQGILAVHHYIPLHASEMGLRYGAKADDCPISNQVSDQIIRLPFFNSLADAEQDKVISALLKY